MASSTGPTEPQDPECANDTGGISIEHWPALHLFAKLSHLERHNQHGLTGKGSPFSALASIAGGWKTLKKWELYLDDSDDIIDGGGRRLIPSEFFTLCICSAALEVSVKLLDGRVNSSAIIDVLARSRLSAGSINCNVGGRPPLYSIAAKHIDALLCEDGCAASAGVALNRLAHARSTIVQTPELRRFLSFIPFEWPTSAVDSVVIDEFRTGARSSIIWHGPTQKYLRHKLESIASLMGVCMTHTNSYPVCKTGTVCDVFRCHRRQKGAPIVASSAPSVELVAVDAVHPAIIDGGSDDESDVSDASSDCSIPVASPDGITSVADEARVAASASVYTTRALRRSENTMVGVGCGCSWVLKQSSDRLTWFLIQHGKHTGHTPGDEESNSKLPLPAEWEHTASAGVTLENSDPAHAAHHYLGVLDAARLIRDRARVYSDQDGEPLPGFGHDHARSPGGVFRARRGRHLLIGEGAAAIALLSAASEQDDSPPGRGNNAPFVCICGQPRDAEWDGPLIRCTRARTCLRGGMFHLATLESPHGCVQQADLELDSTYTCPPCKKEMHEEEQQKQNLAVAADLQDDAAIAVGFNDLAAAAGETMLTL